MQVHEDLEPGKFTVWVRRGFLVHKATPRLSPHNPTWAGQKVIPPKIAASKGSRRVLQYVRHRGEARMWVGWNGRPRTWKLWSTRTGEAASPSFSTSMFRREKPL